VVKKTAPHITKGTPTILAPPEDYGSWNVSFAFHQTQPGYGVPDLADEEKIAFLNAMNTRSQMTWNQMHLDPRGLGVHAIPLYRFRVPFPASLKDQTILSTKCGGLRRLIGYRVNATFCVVWFDPYGNAYPHGD
jgi:hypothetical protein